MNTPVVLWPKKITFPAYHLRPALIPCGGEGDYSTGVWLTVMCCVLLAGCGSSDLKSEFHDTSVESADHVAPPHKPQTFESLVTALQQHLVDLTGPTSDKEADQEQHRIAELRDLIQWIPELAAASELRRADFDRAAVCRERLLQALEGLENGRFQNSSGWTESLSVLQELIPAARDAG
jgi:hypothetical protein